MRRRLISGLMLTLTLMVLYTPVASAHGMGGDEKGLTPGIATGMLVGLAGYLFMVWDIPKTLRGK